MVLGSLKYLELYKQLSPNISKGIKHFLENDYTKLSPGRHEIEGDNIFVLVNHYETKEEESCRLEAHKKYIDIQIMLKGREKIGYASLTNQKPSEEYSDEKDVMFFDCKYDSFLLEENMFALFFPNDIHMPGITHNQKENIIKAVMKIKYDL